MQDHADISPRRVIGIFGGTFDPPHAGHLAVARAALREGGVDEVWLMVSPENPFKSGRHITPERERLEMTRRLLAALGPAERQRIRVSDFEMHLPRPTFTAVTLSELRHAYPGCEFRLIIGRDNLSAFSRWRDPEDILRHHRLIVYPRPGDAEWQESKIPPQSVILRDMPLLDISSTRLRELARSGADVSHLTSPEVATYIKQHKIYDRE